MSLLNSAVLRTTPSPRQVHLWSLRTLATDGITNALRQSLSPDEKSRADRFRLDRHRRAFTLTRAALRALLGMYLERAPGAVAFAYSAHGKPGLAADLAEDPSLFFNVSHSGDLALFAFASKCPVGVDVERERKIEHMQQIANRFFCPAEAAEWIALAPDQRQQAFFLCWTRKEAYIKATGEGMSAALDSFRVSLDPARPAAFIHLGGSTDRAAQWTLHSLNPAPGYLAALAYHDVARCVEVLPLLDPADLLDR